MTRYIAVIAAALVVALTGCGSRQPIQVESYTFPAIGTVATRGVGDSLIRQDIGVLVTEIEVLSDTMVGSHRLPKGRYEYYHGDATGTWFTGGDEYFYMREADGHLCNYKAEECSPAKYTLDKKLTSLSQESFQQTLLYNGKIGTRITLGYREFRNNLARPAFSNNVDYDLVESTVIGYKEVRLEIIKATNTEITYKVLTGFGK